MLVCRCHFSRVSLFVNVSYTMTLELTLETFSGVVAAFDAQKGLHMVHYDDGDKRLEELNEVRVQWLQSDGVEESVKGKAAVASAAAGKRKGKGKAAAVGKVAGSGSGGQKGGKGAAGGGAPSTSNLCDECHKPTKGGKKTERCECEQCEECSAKWDVRVYDVQMCGTCMGCIVMDTKRKTQGHGCCTCKTCRNPKCRKRYPTKLTRYLERDPYHYEWDTWENSIRCDCGEKGCLARGGCACEKCCWDKTGSNASGSGSEFGGDSS